LIALGKLIATTVMITENKHRRWLGSGDLASLALLAALAGPAGLGSSSAAWSADQASAVKRLTAQPGPIPEAAANIARRETGGRVLSLTPIKGGQEGYRIRLLLDGGRVVTVVVDAQGNTHEQA